MTNVLAEIAFSFFIVIAAAVFFASIPLFGDLMVMAASGVLSLFL